jgi:glutamate/tyrosine decarboxylase-like PLP-dependent enzyme
VLFRDPSVGSHYRHDSPYTYFSSKELHLGEISLECSRPGAAAVALWATQRMMPLVRGGEFARRLNDSRAAALELHALLAKDARFIPAFEPELDIVVWAVRAKDADASSARAREIFGKAEQAGLHLALAELPTACFGDPWNTGGTVTALRSVLMKPEHRSQVQNIRRLLDESAA